MTTPGSGPAGAPKAILVGLELYTVRTDLKRDLAGTLTAVARMGYQEVEFYSTYLDWTPSAARDIRAQLDDLGIVCRSTHNGLRAFTPEALPGTIELNQIIGSASLVVASVPPVPDLESWKTLAGQLTAIADRLRPHGLSAGFHNHQKEWTPVQGERPIDVMAGRTPGDFVLQLDVGSCVEAGADPVAFINANPGRFRSVHCKDWSAARGYAVTFGDGDCPWTGVFEAAETTGGVESYLIEQGQSTPDQEFHMAQRGLENWNRMRSASVRP